MKTLMKHSQSITFHGEDGEKLRIGYDNRGKRYRRGIELWLESGSALQGVFIDETEVRRLQDLLDLLYPRKR